MPGGRPSKFDPEKHIPIAKVAAKFGATHDEIADELGIDRATFYRWKVKYPELRDALKIPQAVANERVAGAMYKAAIGYEYEEVKYIKKQVVDRDGCVHNLKETHTTIKHVPPNPTLAIFWSVNKDPENWKDIRHVEVGGDLTLLGQLQKLDEKDKKGKEKSEDNKTET